MVNLAPPMVNLAPPKSNQIKLAPPQNPRPLDIGSENSLNYPPRIHETSSTTPLEIGSENSLNYPPFEFTEPHRLPPPLEIGNRVGKLSQLPPLLEFTEPHRLPPLSKSGRKT